jgi:hypothetical protein
MACRSAWLSGRTDPLGRSSSSKGQGRELAIGALLICAGTVWQRSGLACGRGCWWLAASRRRAAGGFPWVVRPQPTARTNDLDASKDRRKLWRPATAASVRSCRPPPRRLGRAAVRAGALSLIWVLAPGRGDKMIDGVIPRVRGRSVFLGRPRQRVAAGALREPTAAHLLRCGHRAHAEHLRRPRAARQPPAGAAGRRRPAPAPPRPARPGPGGRGGPACALSTGSRGWQNGGL